MWGSWLSVGSYSYDVVHDGPCAAGLLPGYTTQRGAGVDACARECLALPGCGYFAYDAAKATCAKYLLAFFQLLAI